MEKTRLSKGSHFPSWQARADWIPVPTHYWVTTSVVFLEDLEMSQNRRKGFVLWERKERGFIQGLSWNLPFIIMSGWITMDLALEPRNKNVKKEGEAEKGLDAEQAKAERWCWVEAGLRICLTRQTTDSADRPQQSCTSGVLRAGSSHWIVHPLERTTQLKNKAKCAPSLKPSLPSVMAPFGTESWKF